VYTVDSGQSDFRFGDYVTFMTPRGAKRIRISLFLLGFCG
jgi:hypothetical protein